MALYAHVAKGTWSGVSWSFTLHSTGSLSVGDANAGWAGALGDWWDDYGAYQMPAVVLAEASTATIDQSTGKQISRAETAIGTAGADVTGVLLPPQLAVVCSLRTSLATRAGRGRMYWPGPASDALTSGKIGATPQAVFVTAGSALFSALGAASMIPVLYSRTTTLVQVITSFDVGNVLDTQRRRRDQLVESRTSAVV